MSSFDLRIERFLIRRYKEKYQFLTIFPNSLLAEAPSILCVGARLGGEVRAFKRLGVMAIGIDIEPGNRSRHVLVGDAHDILFPDSSFDALYVNVIDHIKYLPVFAREAKRVLKTNGRLVVDMDSFPPDEWAVHDLRTFWGHDAERKSIRVEESFLLYFKEQAFEVSSKQLVEDKEGGGIIVNIIFQC